MDRKQQKQFDQVERKLENQPNESFEGRKSEFNLSTQVSEKQLNVIWEILELQLDPNRVFLIQILLSMELWLLLVCNLLRQRSLDDKYLWLILVFTCYIPFIVYKRQVRTEILRWKKTLWNVQLIVTIELNNHLFFVFCALEYSCYPSSKN